MNWPSQISQQTFERWSYQNETRFAFESSVGERDRALQRRGIQINMDLAILSHDWSHVRGCKPPDPPNTRSANNAWAATAAVTNTRSEESNGPAAASPVAGCKGPEDLARKI